MEQRFAVGGSSGSARKVLRLAQASDNLPGQFALEEGGASWCSLQGSLEAGFTVQLRLSIGLPGRAHLHARCRRRTSMSAGPSQALASLNLRAQAAHSARRNLALPLWSMKRVLY
jgi:hypothetical protein